MSVFVVASCDACLRRAAVLCGQNEAGYNWTVKLESMCKDVSNSKVLTDEFKKAQPDVRTPSLVLSAWCVVCG